MARDWLAWHEAYERPDSSLTTRLSIVVEMLRDAIELAPSGPVRCLSLCAGEAQDLTDDLW